VIDDSIDGPVVGDEGDDLHPTAAMEVGVKIDPVPEGLDGRDDAGHKCAPGHEFEVSGQGPEGAAAKIPQKPALELEEDPQYFEDDEDDLAMRDVEKKRLPHPLAPFLKTLGVARRTEPSPLAEEGQELFRMTVRAADPGESALRIAAVEIALDDLLDNGPEIAVGPPEMMEKHPVEDGPLRMSRTIHSRHGGRKASRNGPTSRR